MSLTASSTSTKWQRMIRELQAVDVTYERIAIECQLRGIKYTRDAVKNLALGRRFEPRHSPGEVIINMHAKHCGTTYRSE